jgi:DNA topoisomerase-6 subunit B
MSDNDGEACEVLSVPAKNGDSTNAGAAAAVPGPAIARAMAARQRDISVSEFFLKNRHLLGFDSPSKALVTTVKEAVDNALDACEEAGILPDILVDVSDEGGGVYRVAVEDNGPGIVQEQLARIFGKLLYGSKFHKLSQSRGQQGMGISAAGMYAQLTTGQPLHVLSRVQGEARATEMFVSIDTARNRPELHKKRRVVWDRPHGTRVEARLEGHYQHGHHSIGMYLQQTAIANPHVGIRFRGPHGEELKYERCTAALPPRPSEIKPHPRGVELGLLIQMLSHTRSRTLMQFLEREFSRVGSKTARAIVKQAGKGLTARSSPRRIAHMQAAALYQAIRAVPVSAPRTDCLAPIGEQRLGEGLRKEVDAEFYVVKSRPPAVYRGNPFQVEIGIAWGRPVGLGPEPDRTTGAQPALRSRNAAHEHVPRADEPVQLVRFANRVPLLYDQAGCAMTRAVAQTNWRAYGLLQTKGALPVAPMMILVHLASVWVPFTSEAKEAIAAYPEIVRELKLGLQDCGRRLTAHLRRRTRLLDEYDRRARIEKYLPHVGLALQDMLDLSDEERLHTVERLRDVLQQTRKP